MKRAVLAGLVPALALAWSPPARADWPCAGETQYRVAHSAKGKKPIAIGAYTGQPTTHLEYGELRFEDLNGDGKRDLLFQSSCIKGIADSVRWHRVLASCGVSPWDGGEDYVVVYEEEELCTRTIRLAPAAANAKPAVAKPAEAKPAWRDLVLARKTPRGACTEESTEQLSFNGAKYVAGARTYTKRCAVQ